MKVNKTNALAFLAIAVMIFGGAYTFNWVSNTGNGYTIEHVPGAGNALDSIFNIPEMVNNPKIDKVDPVLNEWISTGVRPSNLRRVGTQTSILLFTNGAPSLNGLENTGFFKMGSSSIYYVQALVDGVSDLRALAGNPGVIRMVADFSTRVDPKFGDLESPVVDLDLVRDVQSASEVGQVPESFRTRDILDVAGAVTVDPDYNGTGAYINVHDTGVDYGHAALMGTLAMTNDGETAAFDGTGDYTSGTNLMSAKLYEDYNATLYADQVSLFGSPLTPDGSGNLNLTGYEDLILWSPTYHDAYDWATIWTAFMDLPVPTSYDVSAVASATDAVTFGVSWTRTGPIHIWVPFVLVDTGATGTFDKAYLDWDTGLEIVSWWYGVNTTNLALDYSFDDNTAVVNAANPYLSSDFLTAAGTAGTDGFPDLSVGALGNMYDVHDLDFDGDDAEIWTGIHEGGFGFAYMFDYDSHGTGVAGSIAAQDVEYVLYNNVTERDGTFSIQGVAPGADILATSGLLSTSADIWSYLWVSGFEPDSTGNWTQSGQHMANVSSNSWGYLSFYGSFGDGQVHGFDLYSMFMELLSNEAFVGQGTGLLFVISAGNTGNGYGTMGAPEPLSALLVGASTNSWWRANASDDDIWSSDNQGSDEIIGFSSAGPTTNNYPKVDVVNVGAFDYSTYPTVPFFDAGTYNGGEGANNSYQLFGGTSQAAPYTSAAAAYVLQAYEALNPDTNLSPDMTKMYLKSSATDLGYDVYRQGSGRVDIGDAVNLVHGNSGNLISVANAYDLAMDRFVFAMDSFFGVNSTGITSENGWGINDTDSTGLTVADLKGHSDTGVYFGSLQEGVSDSVTVTTSATVTGTDVNFVKSTPETVSSTTTARYNYMHIDSNFTGDYTGAPEFVQFVLNVNQSHYYDATANGGGFRIWIVNAPGVDAQTGTMDPEARELLTYGYTDYHQISIAVSTNSLGANSYLAIRDDQFYSSYEGEMTPGATFSVTAISYTRTDDSAITVTGGATTSHSVNLDTTGLSPGFYEGYVTFDDGSMVPYTYSVAFEANDFDATGSLASTNPYVARNLAFDNQFQGAVSLSGRRQSGDWRFVDIFAAADGSHNALAVEVNWTNAGTVLNTYLYNYNGTVVAHNAPAFGGAGTWNTMATSEGNNGARLLANLTGYDWTFGGNQWFTLAVHAVRHNGSIASPLDSFTFGAAFLDAKVSEFVNIVEFQRTGTPTVDLAGNPVTNNTAGVKWWSNGTANPIERFKPDNTQSSLGINQFTELAADGTLTNPVGDSGAFTSLLFEEEVFLTAGMSVQAELAWTGGSDVDMIIVAKGDAYDYNNGICGAQASSAANPESFACDVSETGTYVIVATYYSGDGASIDWELSFFGLAAVADTVEQDSTITLSLVDAEVADATYLLTTTTGGWNGGESDQFTFTFDTAGPAVSAFATTDEKLGTTVAIAEVYDAGEFKVTLMKGSDTVLDAEEYSPGNNELVIASSFMEYYGVDTVFTYTATDEFDRVTTGTITIYRDDTTVPEFNSVPADVEVKKGATATLSWDIADSSGGDYKVLVNGVEDTSLAGTWTPGVLSVDVSFDKSGEYFLKLEVYDALENGASDTVKVTVPGGGGGDDGFLPFNFIFAIVAIPVLVTLRRKFNK